MINLNQTPEAIMTMKNGEQATFDGHTFRLDVDHVLRSDYVNLTMIGDTSQVVRIDEEYPLVHVRSLKEVAMMERVQLVARIKAKEYLIG